MIVKNVIPNSLFRKAKRLLESDNFPWFYVGATAYTGSEAEKLENLYNGSFYHIAFNEKPNSAFADVLEDCLLCAADASLVTVNKLIRIRVGMIPVMPINSVNPPHVDYTFPHKVGLLYMNDSDGETVLYNEMYNPDSRLESLAYLRNNLKDNLTIDTKITPEENKIIFFDGLKYHSSSTPANTKRRIAVNYVFV